MRGRPAVPAGIGGPDPVKAMRHVSRDLAAPRIGRLIWGTANAPETRMHLLFLFLAPCAWYASGVLGYAAATISAVYTALVLLSGLALQGLWLYARRSGRVRQAAAFLCLSGLFVILPANWFYNEGANGPTLLLYLVLATYGFGATRTQPRLRAALALGFLLVPVALLSISAVHPEWIDRYPSTDQRLIDLGVSYGLSIVFLMLLIQGYFGRFESEQRVTLDTARRDSLTGLLNHGAFHEALETAGRAADGDAVLLLYDLDHFKQVNDRHGHAYGDAVLRGFAHALARLADGTNAIAGRCGGEEFGVLLPFASADEAAAFDRRLRQRCAALPLDQGGVRFSTGLAAARAEHGFSLDSWFGRADRALYQAKARGRNRLVREDALEPSATPRAIAKPGGPSAALD